MAINLTTNIDFAGRHTPADADYPYGSSKDETAPAVGDGSQYIKIRADDIIGFQQALLTSASIVPTGNADTALASQYMQSIVELASGRAVAYDDVGVADAYVLDVRTNQQSPASLFDDLIAVFTPLFTNTGASTVDVAGFGVKNIVDTGGNPLGAGVFVAGSRVELVYELGADRFVHLNPPAGALFDVPVETPTALDEFLYSDISDGGNTKKNILQALLDLSPGADVQEFTLSGTWIKPASGGSVLVEVWGAGGGGAQAANGGGAGAGGGGAYVAAWFDIDDLGATETATIGAGGTGGTQGTPGAAGGNTSFGSFLTAYGGGGGDDVGSTNGGGGGGGGNVSAGATASGINGGNGGDIDGGATGDPGGDSVYGGGGGGGGSNAAFGGNSVHGGGGGGGGHESGGAGGGGSSFYGGGGGGGGADGTGGAAGTSITAGNGGIGATGAANAGNGAAPGGGGGGSETGTSGDGGGGLMRITTV